MLGPLYDLHLDQAWHMLSQGNPPVIVRLMALNAVFLAIFSVRKAAGAQHMSPGWAFLVQMGVLATNLLVLFQQPVEQYLATIIPGV